MKIINSTYPDSLRSFDARRACRVPDDATIASKKKCLRMVVPNRSAPVGILIVDDHGILRDCLAALLERQHGMKVVGTAATGIEAVQAAVRLQPARVDYRNPDGIDRKQVYQSDAQSG